MTNRKNYLINKKFQFKKTFSVMSIVAITIILIILFMVIVISLNRASIDRNNSSIVKNNMKINTIIKGQKEFYNDHIAGIKAGRTSGIAKLKREYENHVGQTNKRLAEIVRENERIVGSNTCIVRKNTAVIIGSMLIAVLGLIFIYLKMIRETHRISGPIYLMTRYIKEIKKGKYPDMRDLRKDDEFREFYDLFRELAEKIIKLENRKGK